MAPLDPVNRWVLDRVLVLKEAALDFAKRRQLPAPSGWANGADTPTGFSSTSVTTAIPTAKVKPRAFGKTPRIEKYLTKQRRRDGDPASMKVPSEWRLCAKSGYSGTGTSKVFRVTETMQYTPIRLASSAAPCVNGTASVT